MESRSAPDPKATMRPTISWPMITGSSTFKASEPCQRWTSVPQIEHVSIRVRIAPGSSSFGTGTSSIQRGVRNCRTTAALLYEGTVLGMAELLLQVVGAACKAVPCKRRLGLDRERPAQGALPLSTSLGAR